MVDFLRLSPRDFEDLVGDLLEAEWGIRLERFGPGPDGGIDLRHTDGRNRATVVQCKHYAGSNWSSCWRAVKAERDKVLRLKPKRYVLALSVSVTDLRKQKIMKEFDPWVRKPEDILGVQDIESLLRKHPKVEGAHPKLWLGSAEVLRRLINADTFRWSGWTVEDAIEDARLFVQPSCWKEIRERLREHHSCILAGQPGIGKTIAAQMLLLEYVRAGFEPIVIVSNIKEALKLYNDSQRQFFYFDDFLGQTDVTERPLGRNEENHLLSLLRRVKNDGTKRFVLTTREYILQDALRLYGRFRHADVSDLLHRVLIDLDKYSRMDRALVLYNHIWHFGRAFARNLARPEAWKPLVDHANYSPRLIRIALAQRGPHAAGVDAGPTTRLQAAFDNPHDLWESAFSAHLDDGQRCLLRAKLTMPEPCFEADLDEAWRSLCRAHNVANASHDEFRLAIDKLEGSTFLRTERSKGQEDVRVVRFSNPSVRDFLIQRASGDDLEMGRWCAGSVFLEQLLEFLRLRSKSETQARAPNQLSFWGHSNRAETLFEAVERTFSAPSARLSKGVHNQTYHRRGFSVEDRLCAVLRHADLLSMHPGYSEWLETQTGRLRENLDRRDWQGIARLIGMNVLTLDNAAWLAEELVSDAALSWAISETADAVANMPEAFSPVALRALERRLPDLAEETTDWVTTDADDEGAALEALDNIDRLAAALKTASPVEGWDRDAVAERFSEKNQSAGDYNEDEYRPRSRRGSLQDSDTAIQRVFASLEEVAGKVCD